MSPEERNIVQTAQLVQCYTKDIMSKLYRMDTRNASLLELLEIISQCHSRLSMWAYDDIELTEEQMCQNIQDRLEKTVETPCVREEDVNEQEKVTEEKPAHAKKHKMKSKGKVSGDVRHRKQKKTTVHSDKRKSPKDPFRFSLCNIPLGSVLVFTHDKTKTVTVHDDTHVEYMGEIVSMTKLATTWLGKKSLQGTKFFTYDTERLDRMRERIEKEKEQRSM